MSRSSRSMLVFAAICGMFLMLPAVGSAHGGVAHAPAGGAPVADGTACERLEWPAVAAQFDASHASAGADGVTLAFMPGAQRSPQPLLLDQLQQLRGFALGLVSPAIGRYTQTQALLDISQGTRVSNSLYKPKAPELPPLAVDPATGAGRIVGWEGFRKRAQDAPGELKPGLLAASLIAAGKSVGYVGYDGGSNAPAIVAAAGQCGVVQSVSLGSQPSLATRAAALQRQSALTVVSLPPGGYGVGVVRALRAAAPGRLLIVMQLPPDPARYRLLPLAIAGLGGPGGLTAPTTRRVGLVTGTDIPATVLNRLDVKEPGVMDGRPIVGTERVDARGLQRLSERLTVVIKHRTRLEQIAGTAFLLLALLGLILARRPGRRRSWGRRLLRVVALAMFWLPVVVLGTAALHVNATHEAELALAGSLIAAVVTDLAAPWPRAPLIPVVAFVVTYGLDFALGGSNLVGRSVLGPNPFYGARFYGAGNELETIFVITGLIGAGLVPCWWRRMRADWTFAICGVGLAGYLGIGLLGADVGGVIAVAAGFGVAALHVRGRRLSVRAGTLLVLLPIAGLVAVVAIDHLTGSQSHLTRTVVHADSARDLVDIAVRRTRGSINGAVAESVWKFLLIALVALAAGWLWRDRLTAPLRGEVDAGAPGTRPGRPHPLQSALYGGVTAAIVGALVNDSGPAIIMFATVFLAAGVCYVTGRPGAETPGQPSR